jgi:hypothetical protein
LFISIVPLLVLFHYRFLMTLKGQHHVG